MRQKKSQTRRTAFAPQNFVFLFLSIFFSVGAVLAQGSTPISQIQGDSNVSPFAGKQISTRGIVTALVRRGFYIQTPDAEKDANPQTSEGIYVFMNEEAAAAKPGDAVEVTGTVTEYRPRNEPNTLPLTEITRPQVKVVSQNNPLPAPVRLTQAELDPKGKIDQMERFEGMRVRIDSLIVVAPTGGRVSDKTGLAASDGVFFGVVAGAARPFREAGIDFLTAFFGKFPPTNAIFDMNPEMLRIDSDSQIGAKQIDVSAGATLKNVTGIIDYAFKSYTLLVDAANPPAVEGNRTFVPASPAGEREMTVAAFNIENFFDDEINSDNVRNETMYPKEVFQNRLNKASLAVRMVLSNPDVLGIVEVENLKVLKKLAEKINVDAVAAGQANPKYEAFLEEGNDGRGIDVGFLVKTAKVKVVKTEQLAKDVKLEHKGANPNEKLYDRPPFLITVEIADRKTGQIFAVTSIVNHFKSYGGIDDPKDGDRVRNKRRLQAEWLAAFVEQRQKTNPAERIVLSGDFNAFQFNDGYNDLIGILKGKSDPNVLVPSTAAYQTGLVNPADFIDARNRYSYVFGGSAQILDHILINRAARERTLKFGYARMNADFPAVYRNDPNRPERLSDHDAPVLFLSLDEIKPAAAKP